MNRIRRILFFTALSILLVGIYAETEAYAMPVPGQFKLPVEQSDAVNTQNTVGLINYNEGLQSVLINETEVTSGDLIKIEVAFNNNTIEWTGQTSIEIVHEDGEPLSNFNQMIREEKNRYYIHIPIEHTMKDGKYFIKEIYTSGTLKSGQGFIINADEQDNNLKDKSFTVDVNKDVRADFTIGSIDVEVGGATEFEMKFNTSELIAEYVSVIFETERGNEVSYYLIKRSDTLYSRTITNTEKMERGTYKLKSFMVYGSSYEVQDQKADFITVNEDEIIFQGGSSDYSKPVIKQYTLKSDISNLEEDVELEIELEDEEEIIQIQAKIESWSMSTIQNLEFKKIDGKLYSATISASQFANYDLESEVEYTVTIQVKDEAHNVSAWFKEPDTYITKVNEQNHALPEILGVYTEVKNLIRGEKGVFYVEVERTEDPLHEINISYMSTDYYLWWYYALTEKDIDEDKSDETKIVYKGTMSFPEEYKSSTYIPRVVTAVAKTGYTKRVENNQLVYSYFTNDFEDYSKGTFTVKTPLKNTVKEISGNHRYRTAVEISKLSYEKSDKAVLVLGTNFPDALAAGPLAFVKGAPILLTKTNDLTPATEEELVRLEVKEVYLLGGNGVISESVEVRLEEMGITVVRIAGDNRYQTAVEAAKLVRNDSGITGKVIITNSDEFADSLSIGSYAAKENLPILLTRQKNLSGATRDALLEFGITEVIIMGGEAAVSKEVEEEISSLGLDMEQGKEIQVRRIAGDNRYLTAMNAAKENFVDADIAVIASGEDFADALAAAPYAAKINAPIILVRKDRISSTVEEYLLTSKISDYRVVGGDAAVSDGVKINLKSMRD